MWQRVFDLHRELWTFNADRDPKIHELIARQQLRLISDVARIVAMIMIPVGLYMIVNLYIHASTPFFVAGLIGLAAVIFISLRNFHRDRHRVFDIHLKEDAALAGLALLAEQKARQHRFTDPLDQ